MFCHYRDKSPISAKALHSRLKAKGIGNLLAVHVIRELHKSS